MRDNILNILKNSDKALTIYELQDALDNKIITLEQFNLALKTGKFLTDKYSNKHEVDKLLEFTNSYLQSLLKN